jgi:methionyl-tRNA formyltransferase
MKVVFMGTPDYALPSLRALHAHHEIVLVVTQPDRRRGRGQRVTCCPVKSFALNHDLSIWQPQTLRDPLAAERLREANADVHVTAAFGLLLPPEVLDVPPHGCVNVHASLLPRWRGAAPVSAAILHGDDETGVTLMRTDEGLDTGPILAQVRCPIRPDDTTEILTDRLAHMGADLLLDTLPRWVAGQIEPCPQCQEEATLAPRLTKTDGRIDWHRSAAHVERMIRAYTPWPGAYTTLDGQLFKLFQAQVSAAPQGTRFPGRVFSLSDNQVAVATGDGALILQQVQLAGSRAMSIDAFCRGHQELIGSTLGA